MAKEPSAPSTTVGPISACHPKRNDKGEVVKIERPSQPTEISTWANSSAMAKATPGVTMPDSINGVPITPVTAPRGAEAWERSVIDHGCSAAFPLKLKPGKKAAAGAVVLEPDGRVWLVEPTNRFWGYVRTFPKGTKGTEETNYSLEAVAAKETFEEAGLLIEVGPPLIDVERTRTVCRYFLSRRVSGDPSEMGWESQAVCLVPLAQLAEMLESEHDCDEPILMVLRALDFNRKLSWGHAGS